MQSQCAKPSCLPGYPQIGAGLLALAWLLNGCTLTPPAVPEPKPVEQQSEQPRLPPPVLVVLSDSLGTYREVCYVLSAALGRPYRILDLAHRSADSVRRALAATSPTPVVVIGERALDVAAEVPDLNLIYAGVLEGDPAYRGVDALPSFEIQLDYWLERDPGLERLGVIGSARMRERIAALASAAAARDLSLEQREVTSDKEAAFAFRSMVPRIDGFVFLPDASILSPAVITEIMRHGNRNDVQMLVYSPAMYALGATLHVEADPVNVAEQIIAWINLPVGADPDLTALAVATEPLVRQPTRMRVRYREEAR